MRRIILSNVPPESGGGILLNYGSEIVKVKGWNVIDIRAIINENENKWLYDVHKWHGRIVEKLNEVTCFYSLLPVSRLILWDTTNKFSLKPLLFLLALIKIFDKTDKDIFIINPDDFLVDFIKEWLLSNEAVLINKLNAVKTRWLKDNIQSFISYHLRSLLTFGKIIYLLIFHRKENTLDKIDIVVNSTLLNKDLLHENGDHFFGFMIDDAFKKTNKNIVWIYNDLFVKGRNSVNQTLNAMGRNARFLPDFFRWSDLFFSLFHGYSAVHKIKKNIYKVSLPINIEGLKLREFSSVYIKNLALYEAPLLELMAYRQFSRLLNNHGVDSVIFPYEGKTIENALLLANESINKKAKSIGYAHAGYSKGNLFIKRHEKDFIPRPDRIAVTGPEAKNRFILAAVPKEQVVNVGTPRYQKRIDDNALINIFGSLKVLFICGYGFEMVRFANMLVQNRELARNHIIIRRSFHSWKEAQDAAEETLLKNKIPYTSTDNVNLLEDIDYADVVLYESTSAAFQASLRGKLVFKVCVSDVITTEHFVDEDNINEVDCCLDSNSLMDTLNHVKLMTSKEYKELAKRQRLRFNEVYSEINKERLEHLFS